MQVESGITKWTGRVPPLDLSNISSVTDKRWSTPATMANTTAGITQSPKKDVRFGNDGLPIDPRDWSRAHVWTWLINVAHSEGLETSPELAYKFQMNGKALCLMSLDMYLSRVPVGGKMLYRDFRVRLARAMSL